MRIFGFLSLGSLSLVALPLFTFACVDRGAPPSTPEQAATALCAPSDDGEIVLEQPVGQSTTPPVRRAPLAFDDMDPSAIRTFYEVLAPYGAWRDDPRLGVVWSPAKSAIGPRFVPYATNGRWTHRTVRAGDGVEDEYVWVSTLPWGWVTFHYGRWALTGGGWAWIPGRRYAGAWVDWRAPEHPGDLDAVIGWGPTPPSRVWRVSPDRLLSRASGLRVQVDAREARFVAVPYAAFATPYTYVRARDLFASDVGARLLYGPAALAVAGATRPSLAPSPAVLGLRDDDVPAPPVLDRGLQQAWMLASPATARAVGAGPELPSPPRDPTWVAGGPRWATLR